MPSDWEDNVERGVVGCICVCVFCLFGFLAFAMLVSGMLGDK